MTRRFDLIAIGTGSGATAAASKCRSVGWEVAIVDSRPFGGTCALRGCDPKKVLVGASDVFDWDGRMNGKGILAEKLLIDWEELMRFKRSFTGPVPKRFEPDVVNQVAKRTRELGVDVQDRSRGSRKRVCSTDGPCFCFWSETLI
jgi:glutathione reductase (NADPH)